MALNAEYQHSKRGNNLTDYNFNREPLNNYLVYVCRQFQGSYCFK